MVDFTGRPAYLQIADDLRDHILSGRLAAGEKLPSESDLMREYDLSRTVAKMAISVLRSEGLISSHPGKGSFVRTARDVRRLGSERYRRHSDAAPPFASDATTAGQPARWQHRSREEQASSVIAERLLIDPGDAIMVTDYRFFAGDEPMQLSTSYEPLDITRGTAVELPEGGDVFGVIARMDAIGRRITEVTERITTRAPRPHEAEALAIPAGVPVLCIARTHYAESTPLETANIVVPGDRYEVAWRTAVS